MKLTRRQHFTIVEPGFLLKHLRASNALQQLEKKLAVALHRIADAQEQLELKVTQQQLLQEKSFYFTSSQQSTVFVPVKGRTRVRFSSRGNVTVADNLAPAYFAVVSQQGFAYGRQGLVLYLSVCVIVRALQFDANTEVVAIISSGKARLTCMPGTLAQIHKLHHLPVAANQHMRRYLGPANLVEKGMLIPVQAIGKQALNTVTAVLARWQGNIMDDQ